MIQTARALNAFFGSFGIPAYSRNNVPPGARMPYITYELRFPGPLSKTALRAWVWYPGTAFSGLLEKCGEIESALRGGASVRTPGGAVRLFADGRVAFAQEQPDPDKSVRVMLLSMILHADTD
ncbi:MAG: hypothetical protein IKE30_07310 [Clostridia bacterium]|nr:hypothetical protein [Clostridia bacterium]